MQAKLTRIVVSDGHLLFDHVIRILSQTDLGGIINTSGMTGFDGGGWSRIASREVPNS